ncbi:hypothetical protein [Methanosarcina barkeri]|uniref:hypothetical protein n=1 Tax=Methanosarcina barkeri TaxID=2208 RepID=UPI001FB2A0FF|nr:hypothetical protein [Methanosarcina barkeri]
MEDGARYANVFCSSGLELLKVILRSRNVMINQRNDCGTTVTLKRVVSGKFQNSSIFLAIFAYNY